MGLFNRKKQASPPSPMIPISKPKCQHKWRDFNWYLEYNYNDNHLEIWIKEPYVCCWCKERKDIILEHITYSYISDKKFQTTIEELEKQYSSHLKKRALIEDEIEDMRQNIDREYLAIVARCFPEKLGLSEEELNKFLNK